MDQHVVRSKYTNAKVKFSFHSFGDDLDETKLMRLFVVVTFHKS